MARSDIKHRLGPYRDPEIDPAVFAATRRLLIERGYRGTSIDAIADAAGVSRPTIYRRWPSKAHVVYDAVYPASAPHVEPSAEPFPEITGAIAGILAFMSQPEAREAFPGLLADMRSDPELKSNSVSDIRSASARHSNRSWSATPKRYARLTQARCSTSFRVRRSTRCVFETCPIWTPTSIR